MEQQLETPHPKQMLYELHTKAYKYMNLCSDPSPPQHVTSEPLNYSEGRQWARPKRFHNN